MSELAAVKDDPVNSVQQSALKAAGGILLGIAAFLALVFLFALWVSGILWVSEKVVWYVWTAADIAFWVCLVVLLPLSLFRVTRKASFFGIFGASFIFGLCTWILGFLTTYEYWGGFGIFVGLVLGIVGIVPVGILASIFHADWTSAIFITMGLVLTYGARSFAAWLAIKIDREASAVAARADTINAGDQGTESGSAKPMKWGTYFIVLVGVVVSAYALSLVEHAVIIYCGMNQLYFVIAGIAGLILTVIAINALWPQFFRKHFAFTPEEQKLKFSQRWRLVYRKRGFMVMLVVVISLVNLFNNIRFVSNPSLDYSTMRFSPPPAGVKFESVTSRSDLEHLAAAMRLVGKPCRKVYAVEADLNWGKENGLGSDRNLVFFNVFCEFNEFPHYTSYAFSLRKIEP